MTRRITEWIFLIFVGTLPLVRPFVVNTAGFSFPIWDFLFLILCLFVVFSAVFRQLVFAWSTSFVFIGLYGLSLCISAVFSTNVDRSVVKLFGEFYLFGLAFIAVSLSSAPEFARRVSRWWLAGTTAAIVFGAIGFVLFYVGYKTPGDNFFLSHFGSLPEGNYPRIRSLFANANMYCNYLNVSLMIIFGAMGSGWIPRALGRILVVAVWIAALFTFSPGIGGLALSSGLWAIFGSGGIRSAANSKRVLAGGMFLIAFFFLGAALLSPDTSNTATGFQAPLTETVIEPSVRVLVWQNVLENVSQRPLTGFGVGVDPGHLVYTTVAGKTQILSDAHNIWLNVFGQAGLVGLIAVLSLTGYISIRSVAVLKVTPHAHRMRIALACAIIGAFLYQGVTGSFEDARHVWVLFGLFFGSENITETGSESASQAP